MLKDAIQAPAPGDDRSDAPDQTGAAPFRRPPVWDKPGAARIGRRGRRPPRRDPRQARLRHRQDPRDGARARLVRRHCPRAARPDRRCLPRLRPVRAEQAGLLSLPRISDRSAPVRRDEQSRPRRDHARRLEEPRRRPRRCGGRRARRGARQRRARSARRLLHGEHGQHRHPGDRLRHPLRSRAVPPDLRGRMAARGPRRRGSRKATRGSSPGRTRPTPSASAAT